MNDSSWSRVLPFQWRRGVILLLLLLAAAHTVISYFHSSSSYLNLQAYAQGSERNPFQSRIGMIPFLRVAERSPAMQRVAAKIRNKPGGNSGTAFREMTPEALASILAGLASVLALVLFLYGYGNYRFARLWWLPAAAFLAMLDVTLATRYEINIWYPYDLPHFCFFGMASVCFLEGWWAAGACFFLLDLPMRETSVFLLPVLVMTARSRGATRAVKTFLPLALLACWIPLQMYTHYRFLHNPSEAGFRLLGNLRVLANPANWPQCGSAFGFLLVPLIFGKRFLAQSHQAFLLGALPGFLLTALFGVWIETRIFDEWLAAVACLVTYELAGSLDLPAGLRLDPQPQTR